MGLRATINLESAEEEDVGAGENVILSITVWRSVWNAVHQRLVGLHDIASVPCIPFRAIEKATE